MPLTVRPPLRPVVRTDRPRRSIGRGQLRELRGGALPKLHGLALSKRLVAWRAGLCVALIGAWSACSGNQTTMTAPGSSPRTEVIHLASDGGDQAFSVAADGAYRVSQTVHGSGNGPSGQFCTATAMLQPANGDLRLTRTLRSSTFPAADAGTQSGSEVVQLLAGAWSWHPTSTCDIRLRWTLDIAPGP